MANKNEHSKRVPTGRALPTDRRLVVLLNERDESLLQHYCRKKGIALSTFARDVIMNELWRLMGEENPTIF